MRKYFSFQTIVFCAKQHTYHGIGSINWLAGDQEIYIAILDSHIFLDPFHKDLRGNDVLAHQSATINISGGSWISQRDLQLQRWAANLLFYQFFPQSYIVTSICGNLPRCRMASIISQIVVVLVNRMLSDGSVSWPRVRRRNLPQYPVMKNKRN